MATVNSFNIDLAISDISDLQTLQALEQRSDWPLPAREAAMYRFTRSLASMSRDAVADDVMQHLRNYQARVLVSHDDHGDASVPLFNIRATAAGVENGWLRNESAAEAGLMIAQAPARLVSSYLESNSLSQRAGYLDALESASVSDMHQVQKIALGLLHESPEFTSLLAITAVATADVNVIKRLLIEGNGPGLTPAIKSIGSQTSLTTTAMLLKFAIEQAPADNAALAIAAWWPELSHDAATRQLLLSKLDHPALGSSAALALARNPDIQTIRELQLIAEGDSIAARRAQLALRLDRDNLIEGARK